MSGHYREGGLSSGVAIKRGSTACMHVYMYMCVCVCVCVCGGICTCVCVCEYVHVRTMTVVLLCLNNVMIINAHHACCRGAILS